MNERIDDLRRISADLTRNLIPHAARIEGALAQQLSRLVYDSFSDLGRSRIGRFRQNRYGDSAPASRRKNNLDLIILRKQPLVIENKMLALYDPRHHRSRRLCYMCV
jgi:hypothetical protein